MRTNGMASVGVAGLALGTLLAFGMAQPGESECAGSGEPAEMTQDTDGERTRRGGPSFEDPEAIKNRLRASIERGERMVTRQREALERLEAGDSPAEVMRTLRVRAWDRRDRNGGGEAGERRRDEKDDGRRPPEGEGHEMRLGMSQPDGFEPERVEPISPEELRAFLAEHFPKVQEQLDKLGSMSPEAGERLFDKLAPKLNEVASDMRRDQRLGMLRVDEMRTSLEVFDATQAYAMARGDDAKLAEAEEGLRQAIGARFDARVALRMYEVERLVARIGALNEEIQAEMGSRDDEVERGFREITRRLRARGGRPRP